MSSSGFYVAVIGPGGVGSIFLSQLSKLTSSHPQGPSIHLVALIRSKTCIKAANLSTPLSLQTWSSDLSSSTTPSPTPTELASWLAKTYPPHRSILVDNTSSQSIADAYPLFLQAGISIITPNKKAFSSTQTLFDTISRAAYNPVSNPTAGLLYHESSVGAGMPILCTLKDLLATGDRVRKIEGVMSGSLSFLFNSFMPLNDDTSASTTKGTTKGTTKATTTTTTTWSEHVVEAKNLGYTEPDPRDDLSGLDVARKLTILARVAGLTIPSPDSFPIESLIPKQLTASAINGTMTSDEFLTALPRYDSEMEALKAEVRSEGQVLRYIGSADLITGELSVKMVRVGAESPAAGLRGSANVFSFWTDRYGGVPLVVAGAGAGGEVTAMGVMGDLIRVMERLG